MGSFIAMIDPELAAKLDEISVRVNEAYHSAESTRKYLFWTGVITAALVIIPLIGLAIIVPHLFNSYSTAFSSVGL